MTARKALFSALVFLAAMWEAVADPQATLIPNLGDHHHAIATDSPEAQRFFDQGLILTFAFNHDEAIRSFEKAHELDPASPMPLWGKALALGPNYNLDIDPPREKVAHETIEAARKLASDAPDRERAYVEALAIRYSGEPDPDLKQLAREYAAAMGTLSQQYPDDLDAATLYAESLMNLRPWQLWTSDHKPAEGTMEIVAILESVLARDPDHPGANHFYIHAVEASAHPEWALPSAQRLERLSPAAGHLVHMPSHVYLLLGDYKRVVGSNDAAARTDHSYIEHRQAEGIYPALYYHHNLHFIAYGNAMLGRYNDAAEAADQLAASMSAHGSDVPELQIYLTEYFTPYPLLTAARFSDWAAVMKTRQPHQSLPISNGFWHYARGLALAAAGDAAKAEAEGAKLAAIRDALPAEGMYGLNAGSDILGIASSVLDARIAAAEGDRKAAIDHLKSAVSAQDRLAYNEPPDWYYPVRESLGAMLLQDGQAVEAEKVFRADLSKNRRSGRSLFGLMEALSAQGRSTDADLVRARFERAWSDAEISLSLGAM
jgi:tetratricopeptide (TPR) repeat protein